MNLLEHVLIKIKKAFLWVFIFSFILNALMMVVPLYMLQIYDRVFSSYSLDTLVFLTIITIFALIILASIEKIRSLLFINIGNWFENKLSPEALLRSVDQLIQGNIYPHQVLRDISSMRQFLGGTAMIALMDAPWVPIYLAVIYLFDPILGFIATCGAAILLILAVLNEYLTRDLLAKANEINRNNQFKIELTLKNAESIQAMGMIKNIIKAWFKENSSMMELQSSASFRSSTLVSVTKFFRFLIQVVMLGSGAFLVIHSHISGGVMIAATIILSKALSPVEQSISAWGQFIQCRNAYNRLQDYFINCGIRDQSINLPRPKGALQVQNLTYSLPQMSKPLLNKINFALQPGEILVILGPSASGKSTLARLIVGALKANEGIVRLDGADVFTWPRHQFGEFVGYLPQNIELFPGSIKENIARMADGNDDAIIMATQKTGVHQMILKFPHGYETVLKDAGAHLSGGQKQRIGLARALYNDPCLIVLDEPNASLDLEGENLLIKTLIAEKEAHKTIVLISHKPNVLQIADKILILKDGNQELFGSREEVLEKIKRINRTQSAP